MLVNKRLWFLRHEKRSRLPLFRLLSTYQPDLQMPISEKVFQAVLADCISQHENAADELAEKYRKLITHLLRNLLDQGDSITLPFAEASLHRRHALVVITGSKALKPFPWPTLKEKLPVSLWLATQQLREEIWQLQRCQRGYQEAKELLGNM